MKTDIDEEVDREIENMTPEEIEAMLEQIIIHLKMDD